MQQHKSQKIGIVGGGIIGLSTGWLLARRGADVTLFERNEVGKSATHVAAGMLAPHAEVGFEELDLMKLGQRSLSLYPEFLEKLKEDAGEVPVFDQCGTMMAGVDRDDTEILRRLYDFREKLGLRVEMMPGSQAREREPLLSPATTSAIWLPDDAQIDNRKLVQSLKTAFVNCGGTILEQTEVQRVTMNEHRVTGVDTGHNHGYFNLVVLAAGCWTGELEGIPDDMLPPVRPVKGQILTLQQTGEFDLTTIIRTPRVYLVPKEDGTLRVGATSEEQGFNVEPTAGGMKELLDDGWEIVPSIYDLPVEEFTAGLRPASLDHAPVIGASALEGLYFATGHYRDGILYAPVTSFGLTQEILEGKVSEDLNAYRPSRFHKNRKS